MAKIDFYIIQETEKNLVFRFVCHFIEKAYAKHPSVYVHLDHLSDVHLLNELLWTFHDISFIPHSIVGNKENAPIQLGYQQKPKNITDILINLSSTIPDFYSEFNHIIEIVPEIEDWKKNSRLKFQTYKQNKHEIQTHKRIED